jgi:hypothetical protein
MFFSQPISVPANHRLCVPANHRQKEKILSNRKRMLIWSLISIAAAASAAIAIETARPKLGVANPSSVATSANPVAIPVNQAPAGRVRNLALQPEAFKLSRKLGQRFKASRREVSVMAGTLIVGSERHSIQIVRRQSARGEQVEIATAGGSALLTWSEAEGARGPGGRPQDVERVLIERLALDSADQFVLAQLRGASYYTVARNVRPVEARDSDGYSGPLWDIVRVSDPEQDEQKRPLSKWRLYYVNTTTGLIDKVVSEIDGEAIEAVFSGWTDQGGEKFPSQITWTRHGQAIMTFKLTTVSHSPQQ